MTARVRRPAVALAASILLLSGCSGGSDGGDGGTSDGRPSEEAIASAIEAGSSGLGVPPAQADCAAEQVVDSDMSDEAIARYLPLDDPGFDDDYAFTPADSAAFEDLLGALETACGFVRPGG